MRLGLYTIGTQVVLGSMKLLGLADNVSWGWVLAPAFVHTGAALMLYIQYLEKKKFIEAFARQFGIDPTEGFIIPVEDALDDDDDATRH